MGARRIARILALQAIYSHDLARGGSSIEELLNFSWIDKEKLDRLKEESLSFARLIISGTIENLEEIDENIKKQVENWDFSRINHVDLSILRISVYCLLFQKDIPPSVTIDEAIDISKDFGTDKSYRFINGVLDGMRINFEL